MKLWVCFFVFVIVDLVKSDEDGLITTTEYPNEIEYQDYQELTTAYRRAGRDDSDYQESNEGATSKNGRCCPSVSDVTYLLHTITTQVNPEIIHDGDVGQLNTTQFDSSKTSLFIIDGATTWGYTTDLNRVVTSAALAFNDLNVFVVDWTELSSSLFARCYVKTVGRYLGQFIDGIQTEYDLDGSSFVLVGFGLGAHVAAGAGAFVQKKVDHIVGLDPASISFFDTFEVLGTSQAKFVQVIHTSSAYGITESTGHADFYPNGGRNQPGCVYWYFPDDECSHSRSYEYFAESLDPKKKFTSTLCTDYKSFKRGLCRNNKKSLMGGLSPGGSRGDFYLYTNAQKPFSQG